LSVFFPFHWFKELLLKLCGFHVKVRDDGSGFVDELMDVIASRWWFNCFISLKSLTSSHLTQQTIHRYFVNGSKIQILLTKRQKLRNKLRLLQWKKRLTISSRHSQCAVISSSGTLKLTACHESRCSYREYLRESTKHACSYKRILDNLMAAIPFGSIGVVPRTKGEPHVRPQRCRASHHRSHLSRSELLGLSFNPMESSVKSSVTESPLAHIL
jgi:hypothetical protein